MLVFVQIHYGKKLFAQIGAPKHGQNTGSMKSKLWHQTRGQQTVKVLDCSILELCSQATVALKLNLLHLKVLGCSADIGGERIGKDVKARLLCSEVREAPIKLSL